MSILNTGFAELSDNAFLMKGQFIASELLRPPGSTYFSTVSPAVAGLTTALDAFRATLLLGNAPGAASDRDAARMEVDAMIKAIAANLEDATKDRIQLAYTGFDLRKAPERDTTPTATPLDVAVKPTGVTGEAQMSCTAVPQASTYEARATQDLATGPFVPCTPSTSIRGLRLTGLERGKNWFFQIRAIGPNGPSPWSDPATMMVV